MKKALLHLRKVIHRFLKNPVHVFYAVVLCAVCYFLVTKYLYIPALAFAGNALLFMLVVLRIALIVSAIIFMYRFFFPRKKHD